ncbi:unnamed protein product, partial [Pylaiella littoralis]
LKSQLDTLDLEGAATALQIELRVTFKNDETTFYFDLQRRLYTWLKEVKSEHTLFRDREDASGGAGADPSSDGEDFGDSRHAFHFMGGRLATMLW